MIPVADVVGRKDLDTAGDTGRKAPFAPELGGLGSEARRAKPQSEKGSRRTVAELEPAAPLIVLDRDIEELFARSGPTFLEPHRRVLTTVEKLHETLIRYLHVESKAPGARSRNQ